MTSYVCNVDRHRRSIAIMQTPLKVKDSPWYAVLSDLSAASTVVPNLVPLLNSVNFFNVKFYWLLIVNCLVIEC